ncbi:Ig-like domain-containing protein [Flavobacterium cerinum]|nr:T9SS type A sorting domain-containing protein [Flavobacterium cerinum]
MLFLLIGQMTFAQGYVTLGTQVSKSGNYSSSPVSGYYTSRRIQVVYTAAELIAQGGTAGNIQRLAWDVSDLYEEALPNYTIKMAHITTPDIPTSDFVTGATVVKNAFSYTPALGFNDITFDAPFNWNGTSNVLVEICFSDAPFLDSDLHGQAWNYAGVTNNYRHRQEDGVDSCENLTAGDTSALKPRVRFYMQQASCLPPGILTVPTVGENTATINWGASASTPANGYSYYRSTSGTPPTAGATPTGSVLAGVTTVNLTGLAASTSYYVWVKANCGPGSSSSWIGPVLFATLCDAYDITATTAGTRCGPGTVTLGATASGGTIKWYSAATGGLALGSGNSFVTPSISTNTTYYASAEVMAGSGLIGTGTTFTVQGNNEPTAFCNRYANYRAQMVYTAAELTAAGLTAGFLTSLKFNVATLGDAAFNDDYTVRIASTTGSTFADTNFLTTGFTTVFGPQTYTHTATGWQTINFTTPYAWNGTSNIVIEISHKGANGTNNASTNYTTTADTVLFDLNTTTTAGTLSALRPNIVFGSCASVRTAVLATVGASPVLTLSTASAAICVGQTSTAVTITAGATDYDTYVWTPSTGVSGNAVTGWTFNPSATTTYTLNASKSTGTMCAATPVTVKITVNLLPSTITVPATASACAETILPITANGGTVQSEAVTGLGTTLTGDTEQPTAFCNRWPNYWNQIIYTAQELTAAGLTAGNITSLSFNITSLGSGATNDNYTIKLGATNAVSFADSNFLSTTGFSTVYGPTTYTHTESGWQLITFTAPYVWDGVSNIVVNITHDGADSTYNTQTYYTETADNTLLYTYSYDSSTTTSGSLSKKRLNVKFQSSQPTTIAWSPVTNLYTNATATTPYVAGTNAKTVYFKSSTAAPAVTYTITGTSSASCVRTATVAVTVSSTVAPTVPAPVQEFCNAGTVANLNATGTALKWYAATTGGTALAATTPLVDDAVYYVSQTLDGCESPRTAVTVNINVTPVPTVPAPIQDLCNAGTVANLNATGTALKWYAAATGGTALAATTPLVDDTIYYVSQTLGGCESLRTALTANINVTPAPTGLAAQTFCGAGTVADLVVTGDSIVWHDAAAGGNLVAAATALVNGTTYYASQSIGGCEGLTRLAVQVAITTVTVEDIEDVDACSQYILPALSNGAYHTAAAGAGTVITAGTAITQTSTIYIFASAGTNPVCTAESSFVVTITNVPAPTGDATQTINADVAANATIEDIVIDLEDGGTVTWYATQEDAANGENPLSANTQLVNGENYFATQTIGECTSTEIFVVVIDVVLGREIFNKDAFNYHPNPVKDVLNLSYSTEITSITVFNLLGQKVISQQPNAADVKVDMSSLADGAYVVNVASGNTVKTIKIIKRQ